PRYLGLLLYGHWGLTGVMGLLVGAVAWLCWWCNAMALAQILAALAGALPCILWQWLVRRAFYVHCQPHWSALGGVLYLVLMLAGMQGVLWLDCLSPTTALASMGVASLAVGLALTTVLRCQQDSTASWPAPQTVLADHWRYGKWASITTASIWISR